MRACRRFAAMLVLAAMMAPVAVAAPPPPPPLDVVLTPRATDGITAAAAAFDTR